MNATRHRPLDLRSEAGKALLELTRQQFQYWEDQLRTVVDSEEFVASHAIHYWYILSTLALEGDGEFKVNKKRVHEALPKASTEAGRKYAAACQAHGLARTIIEGNARYMALTPEGEKVVANTLGRWMIEFSKLRRRHSEIDTHNVDDDSSG